MNSETIEEIWQCCASIVKLSGRSGQGLITFLVGRTSSLLEKNPVIEPLYHIQRLNGVYSLTSVTVADPA